MCYGQAACLFITVFHILFSGTKQESGGAQKGDCPSKLKTIFLYYLSPCSILNLKGIRDRPKAHDDVKLAKGPVHPQHMHMYTLNWKKCAAAIVLQTEPPAKIRLISGSVYWWTLIRQNHVY
jgi:hypothetical protein